MKKLLFAGLLLSSLSSQVAMAQESNTDKLFRTFRFALFLGPTINTLKPTAASADNYSITKGKSNLGFSFGINADYNVNERYTIYTGLGMDWRGGSITATIIDSNKRIDGYLLKADVAYKKMQYLSIPIGLKMKAVEFGDIKVFAQTGFDLGILLSQKGDYKYTFTGDTTVSREHEKLRGVATVVPVNLGWCIGAGAEYSFNEKNAFYASLLYRNGFIDATSPKINDTGVKFSDGNIRSNSWMLRVGYFF